MAHGAHDIWRIETRTLEDGRHVIAPLTVHAHPLTMAAGRVLAVRLGQASLERQDWSLLVRLDRDEPLGMPSLFPDGETVRALDRRTLLLVVRDAGIDWTTPAGIFDLRIDLTPEPGDWWLSVVNRSGNPDGNVWWAQVVADLP